MENRYHILNGDALRERFPQEIPGEIIVTRECLVDGDLAGETLEELFATRARFISETYGGFTAEDYFAITVTELEKIRNLPEDAEIICWFEDDLFCQVNFWFVVSLASPHDRMFLVRPPQGSEYSFGELSPSELLSCYEHRIPLTEIAGIRQLWRHYKEGNHDGLLQIVESLRSVYPFLKPAVQAHLDRIPKNGDPGRPVRTIVNIMEELQTRAFEPVFREFARREPIYGFGDLQVKRLYQIAQKSVLAPVQVDRGSGTHAYAQTGHGPQGKSQQKKSH